MTRRKISTLFLGFSQEPLGDIRTLIESARQRATAMVNSEVTLLLWRIGRRIHTEVLAGELAGCGEQIGLAVAAQLTRDYGVGLAEKSLRRMVRFAATFPGEPFVATLSRQLSWSHFRLLLPLKGPLQREYYAQMCCAERWSVRTLRGRIDSRLYDRTALSRQPDAGDPFSMPLEVTGPGVPRSNRRALSPEISVRLLQEIEGGDGQVPYIARNARLRSVAGKQQNELR